jgi:hypothetical protein
VLWRRHYVKDLALMPVWGIAAPRDRRRPAGVFGGWEPNAKVVALNKYTGKEMWRALASDSEPATRSRC